MRLAGVGIRRVEDLPKVLWGVKASPGPISQLGKQACAQIEKWFQLPLAVCLWQ